MNAQSRRNGQVRPTRRRRVWIAAAIAAAGLLLVFELGELRGGHNRLAAYEREQQLESELKRRRQQNQQLSARIAILETNEKINAEAYRKVESELAGLQDRILEQREDLAFYEGLVSADPRSGLHIQAFDLTMKPGSDDWLLRLVLAQAIRNQRKISGHIELKVDGTRDGQNVTLDFADVAADRDAAGRLGFSFRYFQNLQARLALPEGFAPNRVTVKLTPEGKGLKVVEQTFDWPAPVRQAAT